MLCDSCGKRNAIIAYTNMKETKIEIVHLCAKCAEEKMKGDLDFNNIITEKVADFIDGIFKMSTQDSDDDNLIKKSCPNCNTTLNEVVKENKVGCETCYEVFKVEINNLLKNMESSSIHKGKIPKNGDISFLNRKTKLDLLNKLNVAIELEEYEEAAKLRDEINSLKEG